MGVILCAGKISRYMERECNREFGRAKFGIQNSREIFGRSEEEVWERR